MSLHDKIMNLSTSPELEKDPVHVRLLVKGGHRDARHAAAELAAPYDALIEQMAAALDYATRRLQADIDDGSRPDQWSMEDIVRQTREALAAHAKVAKS